MSLLVVGCTVVDLIFPRVRRLPEWPKHTEFTRSNLALLETAPTISIGGNGANAAFVAARCGAKVALHTNVGRDWFGERARSWLEDAGCRVLTASSAARTAVNVTAADALLRRATLFFPGVVSPLPVSARGFRQALVCGWPHPPLALTVRRMRGWRRAGVRTAFDAGPILGPAPTLRQLAPLFAALDLLLLNEHEARAITRAPSFESALARLRRAFSGEIVVKLGPRGVCWLPSDRAEPEFFPGRAVRAYNTVGAGDTFNGALLASLDRGESMAESLRYANRVAASVVKSAKGVLSLRVTKGRTAL